MAACAPCPFVGASVIGDLIAMVLVIIVFLMVGAVVSFLFFGYLAFLEDYQDMPHEEAHK